MSFGTHEVAYSTPVSMLMKEIVSPVLRVFRAHCVDSATHATEVEAGAEAEAEVGVKAEVEAEAYIQAEAEAGADVPVGVQA